MRDCPDTIDVIVWSLNLRAVSSSIACRASLASRSATSSCPSSTTRFASALADCDSSGRPRSKWSDAQLANSAPGIVACGGYFG
eukprot:scaffold31493_cov101-Isochrysis_galbana.AAC.5